jgi:hypothetical protein
MSTSSFVGLFAVSGVLAVADMHAVLTSMLFLALLLLALLLLAILLLASLHHPVAA